MPRLIHVDKKLKTTDNLDNHISNHKSQNEQLKKISTLSSGHHIYKLGSTRPSRAAYYVVDPNSKKVKAKILGSQEGNNLKVHWAVKHESLKHPMTDVYKHLIIRHNLTLTSDTEHSPGSQKVYKNLANDPDLHTSLIDDDGNKTEINTKDFHKNYFPNEIPDLRFQIKGKNNGKN